MLFRNISSNPPQFVAQRATNWTGNLRIFPPICCTTCNKLWLTNGNLKVWEPMGNI